MDDNNDDNVDNGDYDDELFIGERGNYKKLNSNCLLPASNLNN